MKYRFHILRLSAVCLMLFCLFDFLPVKGFAAAAAPLAAASREDSLISPAVMVYDLDRILVYTALSDSKDGSILVQTDSGKTVSAVYAGDLDELLSVWEVDDLSVTCDPACLNAAAPVSGSIVSVPFPSKDDLIACSYQASTVTDYASGKSSYTMLHIADSLEEKPSAPCAVLDADGCCIGIWVGDRQVVCPWFDEARFAEETELPTYEMRLMTNYGFRENEAKLGFWGQYRYKRRDVQHVKFQRSQRNMPEDAWDVSDAKDGSVMAWMKDGILYVGAADGKIAPNKSASGLFSRFINLETIDFGNAVDTSGVTDMHHMFYFCEKLRQLDLRCFDTSNVTTMQAMFAGLTSCTDIDVSSFDTAKVKDMSMMFAYCSELYSLDLSSFNTRTVSNMSAMFQLCKKLELLDIAKFSPYSLLNHTRMFADCPKLAHIATSDPLFSGWAKQDN